MTIYSTIWSDVPGLAGEVTVVDWRQIGWRGVTRAMNRSGPDDVWIINGALGFPALWRDMMSATALRLVGRGGKLVVSDATWEPRSERGESRAGWLWSANDRMTRAMVRNLAGDRTVFCFLSTEEVGRFHSDLGARCGRAVYTPFFVTAPHSLLTAGPAAGRRQAAPYVFTGGNTLRDWDLLTEALGDCGVEVRVATRHTSRRWPANFRVGPLPREDFFEAAARATAGVLTLRSDVVRSAGQQTYLNLLRLGVPVIVNDAPGVRDHLDRMPGAFVTGSAAAEEIRERVLWLCDEANDTAVATLVARGRVLIDADFSEGAYLSRLATVARELQLS